MPSKLSSPSNFHNSDKVMASPDNFHRLVYYNLVEIAMGGPLRGEGYLETKDKEKVKIHDSCGGPPAWERAGRLVAVPIWVSNPDNGLVQRMSVIDIMKMELRVYSRAFSVVELRSFDGNVIYGVASGSKEFVFDIDKEESWVRMELKGE
jgi:hypothetical protein